MPEWFYYLWYEVIYFVSHFGLSLGFSLRTEGRNHIPKTGPVLVIANHQSFFDPLILGVSSRRHLIPLARKTLFDGTLFDLMIRSLQAVPIDQEGVGKDGLKAILGRLHKGQAVLVFPEGTRTDDGKMNHFRPGIHLLISRAKCPIVPVGIAGAFEAWPYWRPYPIPSPLFLPPGRGAIASCVGEPLDGAKYAAMPRQQAMDELYQQVNALHRRADELRRK